jgi:hypothetical protein
MLARTERIGIRQADGVTRHAQPLGDTIGNHPATWAGETDASQRLNERRRRLALWRIFAALQGVKIPVGQAGIIARLLEPGSHLRARHARLPKAFDNLTLAYAAPESFFDFAAGGRGVLLNLGQHRRRECPKKPEGEHIVF